MTDRQVAEPPGQNINVTGRTQDVQVVGPLNFCLNSATCHINNRSWFCQALPALPAELQDGSAHDTTSDATVTMICGLLQLYLIHGYINIVVSDVAVL